jgi:hypothetical protein
MLKIIILLFLIHVIVHHIRDKHNKKVTKEQVVLDKIYRMK